MVRLMGIIGVLWLVAMGAIPAYAGPFALVQNGRPAADIMIDPKANEYAPYAAKELVAYVKKISGVELKIAKRRNPSRGVIRIGRPGGAAASHCAISAIGTPSRFSCSCRSRLSERSAASSLPRPSSNSEITSDFPPGAAHRSATFSPGCGASRNGAISVDGSCR